MSVVTWGIENLLYRFVVCWRIGTLSYMLIIQWGTGSLLVWMLVLPLARPSMHLHETKAQSECWERRRRKRSGSNFIRSLSREFRPKIFITEHIPTLRLLNVLENETGQGWVLQEKHDMPPTTTSKNLFQVQWKSKGRSDEGRTTGTKSFMKINMQNFSKWMLCHEACEMQPISLCFCRIFQWCLRKRVSYVEWQNVGSCTDFLTIYFCGMHI